MLVRKTTYKKMEAALLEHCRELLETITGMVEENRELKEQIKLWENTSIGIRAHSALQQDKQALEETVEKLRKDLKQANFDWEEQEHLYSKMKRDYQIQLETIQNEHRSYVQDIQAKFGTVEDLVVRKANRKHILRALSITGDK